MLDPLDFLARLAALVPRPRINLTRFHGVFAPNSRLRARVARRAPDRAEASEGDGAEAPAVPASLGSSRWARRLRRVFGIDVESCSSRGGRLRILACIEDRHTVDAILAHLARTVPGPERPASPRRAPPGRAPPSTTSAHRFA